MAKYLVVLALLAAAFPSFARFEPIRRELDLALLRYQIDIEKTADQIEDDVELDKARALFKYALQIRSPLNHKRLQQFAQQDRLLEGIEIQRQRVSRL